MQKLITTLISNCPEDTIQFAKDLSTTIPYGSVIFMIGNLGSGKTTFTKGFAAGLGFSNNVQSPTYPILNEYSDSNKFIYHFDLYRLKSVSEFLEIGGIDLGRPESNPFLLFFNLIFSQLIFTCSSVISSISP